MSATVTAPVDLAFEAWAAEGVEVCRFPLDRWRVGDWLVRCPRRYRKYGPAIELLGIPSGSIRAMRWVAAHVAPEDRVPALSFRHHYEVAKLAPEAQRNYLRRAAEDRLSAYGLHALIASEGS